MQSIFFLTFPPVVIIRGMYSSLDTGGIKKHLVFIQHIGRCHLFYMGFSTFQHLASWLNLLSGSHLMNPHNSQLQGTDGFFSPTNLATASALISLDGFHFESFRFLVSRMWELMTDYFSVLPPSKSLSVPYLHIKKTQCMLMVEVNAGAHGVHCKS